MASTPIESTRRQVALSMIEGFNTLSVDSIMEYFALNCIVQVLPKSVGWPPKNNDDYRTHLSSLLPYFRQFHIAVHDLIEDSAANKVVMWASSKAESDLGPYSNEYMLVLYFNSEGKIEKILEFVDSERSLAFLRQLTAEMEKKPRN